MIIGLIKIFFYSFLLYIAWTTLKVLFSILLVVLQFRKAVKTATASAGNPGNPPPRTNTPGGVEEMALDPTCGSYVSVGHALSADFRGERHYFCSPKCLDDYRLKIGG
jgi:YHS domain-containing protein